MNTRLNRLDHDTLLKKYIYGIYFGTTNSALSILDTENNKIVKTFNEASLLFLRKMHNVHRKERKLAVPPA